ncbi:MAG: hypothetical protein ACOYOV_09235 [Bacteroidales bacterium]
MRNLLLIIAIVFVQFVSYGQTNKQDAYKESFYKAYNALESMLEGKDSLNYEKAVFITENAYHNNYFNYEDFKRLLDFHAGMINAYAVDIRANYKEKYKTLKPWEQCYFKSNTDNWAIFKYITDTAFVKINEAMYYKKPYSYTYQDPYGSDNWENTEVLYLLLSNEKQGNCYSLASLFKIFSDRLKSDARLTIAPHHIYIQNRNQRGDFYNVELASKSFPGDGTIQCLTYTTYTSIKNGMAQRMLNDKQGVALNLIYLAKGFQHKYKDNTNDFLLQCANLAYKYDSLSLNALLLNAEITENRLLASMKENKITKLSKARLNSQTKVLLASYETQLSDLYTLGYREIPKDIERVILAKIQHREEGVILKDKTPNPFASIKAKQRYATLSNGKFDEIHEAVDSIQYYHALLNTKTKKICRLFPIETNNDYKVDPVVFALSVDPLCDKYPSISPYAYCAWNPVMLKDPDGRNYTNFLDENGNLIKHVEDGSNATFKLTSKSWINQYFKFNGYDKSQKGENKVNLQSVIDFTQDYTRETYLSTPIYKKDDNGNISNDEKGNPIIKKWQTYCNFGTRCIGNSVASALKEMGVELDVSVFQGGAPDIYNSLAKSYTATKTTEDALNEAKSGSFVVGGWSGHAFTLNKDGNINNVGAPREKNNIWNPKYNLPSSTKFYILYKNSNKK